MSGLIFSILLEVSLSLVNKGFRIEPKLLSRILREIEHS